MRVLPSLVARSPSVDSPRFARFLLLLRPRWFSLLVLLPVSSVRTVLVLRSTYVNCLPQQAHYDDTAAKADRRLRAFKDDRWAQLSTFDRIMAWAKYHKFKVVIGSWLTSMAGTWLYIQSQPLSFSQKIVQARVWAQGLTLASLLVMAGVTQIPTEADKLLEEEAKKANHSWRDSTFAPGD